MCPRSLSPLASLQVLEGEADRLEAEKAAPPKDYYSASGGFDPLGMAK